MLMQRSNVKEVYLLVELEKIALTIITTFHQILMWKPTYSVVIILVFICRKNLRIDCRFHYYQPWPTVPDFADLSLFLNPP